MDETEISLLPLPAVLFPGAQLELRIVEPRYLAMLGECARDESAFGVCLLLPSEGQESTMLPAAVGTLAELVDFDTLPEGLLGIRVLGTERFRVHASRVRDDGLIRARVDLWGPEPRVRIPAEFGLLATILDRLAGQFDDPGAAADQSCFDDASWVGMHLAELLPLPLPERQHLLELTDPLERLAELRDLLPRFQSD